MSRIKFYKYTHLGNNFVLLDELEGELLDETRKRLFASIATDLYHGIGADNLLCIEAFSKEKAQSIGIKSDNLDTEPDIIFRMFEPDGKEAYCCGNGLLCIALHLDTYHGLKATRILTEVPSDSPVVRIIKASNKKGFYKVKMGISQRISHQFFTINCNDIEGSVLKTTEKISLRLETNRSPFLKSVSDIYIEGFLVYTGEPHLVIIKPECKNHRSATTLHNFIDFLLNSRGNNVHDPRREHKEESSRLFQQIGYLLNDERTNLFPQGININVAKVENAEDAIISCRFYERGINKETLACGTGAVAIAETAVGLGMVKKKDITLLPVRERWIHKTATIKTELDDKGNWWLEGKPKLVYEGFIDF